MLVPPETVVLAGGGARMISQLGALRAIQRSGHLKNVKRIIGTSAGAVLGTALALGRDLDEVFLSHVHHRKWSPDVDLSALTTRYGLDSGLDLTAWIREIMGGRKWTFAALKKRRGVSLEVVATNLSKGQAVYFGPDTSPDMDIGLALRMSCSIPFFFASVLHPDSSSSTSTSTSTSSSSTSSTSSVYVDGAITDNFPLQHALQTCAPELVLGIKAEGSPATTVNTLRAFAGVLTDLLTRTAEVKGVRTFCVRPCEAVACGVTDFTSLTADARLKLFLHGVRQAEDWLASREPQDSSGGEG